MTTTTTPTPTHWLITWRNKSRSCWPLTLWTATEIAALRNRHPAIPPQLVASATPVEYPSRLHRRQRTRVYDTNR